jgi:hypothetical protein
MRSCDSSERRFARLILFGPPTLAGRQRTSRSESEYSLSSTGYVQLCFFFWIYSPPPDSISGPSPDEALSKPDVRVEVPKNKPHEVSQAQRASHRPSAVWGNHVHMHAGIAGISISFIVVETTWRTEVDGNSFAFSV